MFGLGPATKIYLSVAATDMRKGFDGLYGLVRDPLLSGYNSNRINWLLMLGNSSRDSDA